MLALSRDPNVAERQMQAVIFYLTTFGYIDGDFDSSEREFVRNYIGELVAHRVQSGVSGNDELKQELIDRFTKHFHEVFERIDRHIQDLFTEAVAAQEHQNAFIHAKLKLRCFEIFQSFDSASQESLMETIDALIEADGETHPAEVTFRAELTELLESQVDMELVGDDEASHRITLSEPSEVEPATGAHAFFDQFEYHYSKDPSRIQKQIRADRDLLTEAIHLFDRQRREGEGRLKGASSVAAFAGLEPFLDGHVYVHPIQPGQRYELTVLGDLHGCYSCLKGATLQSKFFERVNAYHENPETAPFPLLVLLGDYIDRGLFSLNGVLRTVLQLAICAPKHVVVLRGNHEYYLEYKGEVYGGVKPAEAIDTLKPHLPAEVFQHYMRLFEAMPNMLFFDRMLFVHGGIPRDRLIRERWKDMSTLNDPEVRFQMLWSDPSSADVIPAQLQQQSARFPFGKLQAAAFLLRLGCHTIVRGHERVDEGFRVVYDDPRVKLWSLFSAGGEDNQDLPPDSSYRSVKPKALTISYRDSVAHAQPWGIDYSSFNDPEKNAFFKSKPEIDHKTG
ncbi:MAG: metallophosphoesterase family protein [Myxococcota bacterium]